MLGEKLYAVIDKYLPGGGVAAVRPARQKEVLGEKLYDVIEKNLPGDKVDVSMLQVAAVALMLEKDKSELKALLTTGSEAQLKREVSEAMRSLGSGAGASSSQS